MVSRKARKQKPVNTFEFFDVNEKSWAREPQIDQLVHDLINPKGLERFPGVAVAVRQNQHVAHVNGYGYANLETGSKITPDTIFDLGSLSKQFTALATLELVLGKAMDLNDHLSRFFKGFPRYADSITVEDLLHHTSALPAYDKIFVASRRAEEDWYDRAMANPDHWYPQMEIRRKKELTNKDVLRWIVAQKLLPRAPDIEYEYCNSGYVVLAELVTKVTGMRFADFLRQILFKPLLMNDTYVFDELSRFSPNARQVVNHAKCYNRVDGQFVPVGYTPLNFITGDGNVHSTVRDLLKWELSLFSQDVIGLCFPDKAREIGEGSIIRDLFWAPTRIRKRKQVNYGAGWNLMSNKFKTQIAGKRGPVTIKCESSAGYHRGEWLGWRSYFARGSRWPVPKTGQNVNPDNWESLAIIVLSNADFRDNQFTTCRIAQEVSRLYWGKRKKYNIMNNFNCAV